MMRLNSWPPIQAGCRGEDPPGHRARARCLFQIEDDIINPRHGLTTEGGMSNRGGDVFDEGAGGHPVDAEVASLFIGTWPVPTELDGGPQRFGLDARAFWKVFRELDTGPITPACP